MKVELTISDDAELRAAIKDSIKGEVLSIARGEIKNIIAQAVDEKVIPNNQADREKLVGRAIQQMILDALKAGRCGQPTTILTMIREEVNAYLRELWEKRPPAA